MSQLFYGSICITDILEKAKQKHSAFTKGNNNKIYLNISVWMNDQEDKYGNIMSLLMSSKKEMKDAEGKTYIGNCKKSEFKEPAPIDDKDASSITEAIDDIPF